MRARLRLPRAACASVCSWPRQTDQAVAPSKANMTTANSPLKPIDKIERLLAGLLRCLLFSFIDPRRNTCELIRRIEAQPKAGIAPGGMSSRAPRPGRQKATFERDHKTNASEKQIRSKARCCARIGE